MTPKFILELNQIFPFLLIFSRLGSAFIVMPGFGEKFINRKVRTLFAFILSLALFPVLMSSMPENPINSWSFVSLIFMEIFIGFFIGICVRALFTAIDVAGSIIGFKSGMMNAFVTSPITGSTGSLPGLFLVFLAITLLFITDMHHMIIKTLIYSYEIYKPNIEIGFFDLSSSMLYMFLQTVVLAFTLALQLATPFIILGLLYFMSLGILNRLMPQLPVFFVGQPLQILMGFILLMFVFSSILDVFLQSLSDLLLSFWDPKQINL